MKKLIISIMIVLVLTTLATVVGFTIRNKNVPTNNDAQKIYKHLETKTYGYPEGYKELKIGRNALNEKEVKIYDEIYNAVEHLETKIKISSTPQSTLNKIYMYYLNDTPEHFYTRNLSYTLVGEKVVSITFNYLYPKDEIETKKTLIKKKITPILNSASSLKTEYEKSKYIYEYIIKNTVYDEKGGESIYWIDGVLLNGVGVCQGYAKTYQMLTNFLGIQSTYVRGTSRNLNHGWNLVKLDGNFYHVDSTWGDLSVNGINGVDYSYLNLTDDEIKKDHTIDEKKNPTLPIASSTGDNYFIQANALINNYIQDRKRIIQLVEQSIKNNDDNATLKFANRSDFDNILADREYLTDVVFKARDIAARGGNNISNFEKFGVVKNEFLQTINIVFS